MGQHPTPDHERATKADAPLVNLPKQLLTPSLLLLIDEEPAYGYELVQRLASLGVGSADHGSMYRALNVMESIGLVSSQWERSPNGPRRRRYHATVEGRRLLARWAGSLEQVDDLIRAFLGRWRVGADGPMTGGLNGHNGVTPHDDVEETTPTLAR